MDIFHLFNIKTNDSEKIYNAITQQEGLASWWTTETVAKSEIGSIIEFRFTKNYKKGMKILNLEENKIVEWECIDGDQEWLGTKIKFEIIPKEESTDIKFYHTDWREITDLYGICNYHWGLYMKSLKAFIEEGKGNPHKPNPN